MPYAAGTASVGSTARLWSASFAQVLSIAVVLPKECIGLLT